MEDRRRHVRYPCGASAVLHWEGQLKPATVQVVDISATSATLETTGPLEDLPKALSIALDGSDGTFPLALVRVERTWYGTVVHARFLGLDAAQEALLSGILDALCDEQATTLELMLRGRLLR